MMTQGNYDYTAVSRNPSGREPETGTGLFVFLFLLPILLVSFLLLIIGYAVSAAGGKYRLVKSICFPAAWFSTNFFALLFLFPVMFIYGVVHDKETFSWFVTHSLELAGLPIWGPIVGHFWSFSGSPDYSLTMGMLPWVLYQLAIYVLFGWRINRTMSLVVFEAGVRSLSKTKRIDPVTYSGFVARNDTGYAKATGWVVNP